MIKNILSTFYWKKNLYKYLPKKLIGYIAEHKAYKFLKKHNMVLIERNFSLKCGEIDLIMLDKLESCIVFVEVRYRSKTTFGKAVETITKSKIKKLKKTAILYLQKNSFYKNACFRFDVVSIDENQINWLKNALYL